MNMKKQRLENLMLAVMILIVLMMGSGLFFSCSTPKHFQAKELPEEFTNKCGDCRDLE